MKNSSNDMHDDAWKRKMALDFLLISIGALIIALSAVSIGSAENLYRWVGSTLRLDINEQTLLYIYLTALFAGFVLQGLRGPPKKASETTEAPSEAAAPVLSESEFQADPIHLSKGQSVPDDLICSVAHDFNNILTGALGHLYLAQAGNVAPKVRQLISIAENECTRAAELSRQLLEYAKGPAAVIREHQLTKIMASCPVIRDDQASNIDIPEDTWNIRVDVSQTGEAILNCINYMRQAFPADHTLTISAKNIAAGPPEAGDLGSLPTVHLRIEAKQNEDAVINPALDVIAAEMIPLKSRTGLKMAASLIARQGGTMRYNDDRGLARFIEIYFDAVKNVSTSPAEAPAGSSKGRVLVLDDEPIVRDLARHLLGSFGYSVECANDEQSGSALYTGAFEAGTPFDVVIIDINMRTGADGHEILQRLREVDPNIRAIASSGNPQHPVIRQFEKFGFIDVINKPYRPETISDIVDAVVAMKPL